MVDWEENWTWSERIEHLALICLFFWFLESFFSFSFFCFKRESTWCCCFLFCFAVACLNNSRVEGGFLYLPRWERKEKRASERERGILLASFTKMPLENMFYYDNDLISRLKCRTLWINHFTSNPTLEPFLIGNLIWYTFGITNAIIYTYDSLRK